MNQIIDGKRIAHLWESSIAKEYLAIKHSKKPKLAVILVGENPASDIYIQKKQEACQRIGFDSEKYHLYSEEPSETLKTLIKKLNADKNINGILLQLPLPKHFNEWEMMSLIDVQKDVDGLHPINFGKLSQQQNRQTSALHCCTPKGIMHALRALPINLVGMHAVVVGQSNIVGRPMAIELLNAGCTVTVCHHRTKDLILHTKQAKILVVATGVAGLIKKTHVTKGAIVVDVGTTFVNKKLVGDVDFKEVEKLSSWITPVPGGVGPLTISALLDNTWLAFKEQNNIE